MSQDEPEGRLEELKHKRSHVEVLEEENENLKKQLKKAQDRIEWFERVTSHQVFCDTCDEFVSEDSTCLWCKECWESCCRCNRTPSEDEEEDEDKKTPDSKSIIPPILTSSDRKIALPGFDEDLTKEQINDIQILIDFVNKNRK